MSVSILLLNWHIACLVIYPQALWGEAFASAVASFPANRMQTMPMLKYIPTMIYV